MPHVVFAADVGEKTLSAASLDAEGKFLARQAEEVDLPSPEATVEQISCLARELAGKKKLRAAGIAVPGQVARQGAIWISKLHGEQISLAALLRRRLRVPVHVENNRNAAVLG